MRHAQTKRIDRLLLISGVLGVVGNVLGVVWLLDVPGAYRVGSIDAWAVGVLAHPSDVNASATAFTLGLIALAVWGLALSEHAGTRLARAGGWIFAMGSLANAVGTVTPLVLASHVGAANLVGPEAFRNAQVLAEGQALGAGHALELASRELVGLVPVARALLGVTLSLDALFNLTLGVGLLMMGVSIHSRSRWFGWWAVVAGAASLPVVAQALYDPASDILRFSGPLWLALVLASSFRRWPQSGDAGDAREGAAGPRAYSGAGIGS
ncbi:MAG: hypothetical protein H6729_08315 [Deltaproteobacteria bacterium]|nr:hypothetical protein [Deltaproteobacteria bacterium]